MNYTYSDGSTPVGLDVGTSRIVAAWPVDRGYRFTSQLNSFVALPNSRMTEAMLRKEHVPHTVRGGEIFVHGNESERFADLLGAELRRPMTKGFLNPAEPDSMPIMQHLLLPLLGPAAHARQKLFFSVPAPPIGAHDSLTYHEATLRQILGEQLPGARLGGGDGRRNLIGRHRAGKQEALHRRAAEGSQGTHLGGCLDALGEHMNAERLPERDDRAAYRLALA